MMFNMFMVLEEVKSVTTREAGSVNVKRFYDAGNPAVVTRDLKAAKKVYNRLALTERKSVILVTRRFYESDRTKFQQTVCSMTGCLDEEAVGLLTVRSAHDGKDCPNTIEAIIEKCGERFMKRFSVEDLIKEEAAGYSIKGAIMHNSTTGRDRVLRTARVNALPRVFSITFVER